MINGFYKVERNQSYSFETDVFYNPDTHEYYRVRVSDTDDYAVERNFARWADEPLNEAMWWQYDMDSDKKQVDLGWDYKIRRREEIKA